MNKLNKILVGLAMVAPIALTSCLDDTHPTNTVIEPDLEGSSMALDAQLGGISSYMKTVGVWRDDQATDFAYPSQMIIRDLLCSDMIQVYNNYQHFINFERISVVINQDYLLNQIIWYYYNLQVKAANVVIPMINPEDANGTQLNMLAQALAFRAFIYLDMARLYEFLPNATTSPVTSQGNNVTGLTVPITDPLNPVDPEKNPRATHEEMMKFIMNDLDRAEEYFSQNNSRNDKTRPDLSVVYGLKARAYMWDAQWAKAAEYARKAISTGSYSPTTRDQWLDPKTGFNDMATPSWMFAIHQVKEDDSVQDYSNWTSFMASEGNLGYGARYNNPMVIDKSLYESISDHDWRKLSWKAPAGTPLAGKESYVNPENAADIMDYASLKFRMGEGELSDNNIGWATDIPLMRIEEMYLTEAEAQANLNPAEGARLLNEFMKTYRYSQYNCNKTGKDDVLNEIFKQKRIEFWGEGIIIFDYKRLDKGVHRDYDGTNWPSDCQFNTTGRAPWFNFVMCGYEGELNTACEGWNNPDAGGFDSYN